MRATAFVTAMTAVNLAAMGVVLSGSGAAPQAADVVRTQKLELVDATGKVRGSFRTEPDGHAVFRIMSEKGEIRVKIGGDDKGSGIVLMNDDTAPGVHMLAKASGSTIKVIDPGKPARVVAP